MLFEFGYGPSIFAICMHQIQNIYDNIPNYSFYNPTTTTITFLPLLFLTICILPISPLQLDSTELKLQRSKQISPIPSRPLFLLLHSPLFQPPGSNAGINSQLRLSSLTLTSLLLLLLPFLRHLSSPNLWAAAGTSAYCLHTAVVCVQCSVNVCKTLLCSAGRGSGARTERLPGFDDGECGFFF